MDPASPFLPSFFLVHSAHDTFLCMEKATGRLRHSSHLEDPACVPLLFGQVGATNAIGFLAPWQTESGMRLLGAPLFEMRLAAKLEMEPADQDETEFMLYR